VPGVFLKQVICSGCLTGLPGVLFLSMTPIHATWQPCKFLGLWHSHDHSGPPPFLAPLKRVPHPMFFFLRGTVGEHPPCKLFVPSPSFSCSQRTPYSRVSVFTPERGGPSHSESLYSFLLMFPLGGTGAFFLTGLTHWRYNSRTDLPPFFCRDCFLTFGFLPSCSPARIPDKRSPFFQSPIVPPVARGDLLFFFFFPPLRCLGLFLGTLELHLRGGACRGVGGWAEIGGRSER